MTGANQRLGMILKGYPRISESFISTEILLLEALGIPIDIYSLRQPREAFSHDHVKAIRASATYLPEYVLPHFQTLFKTNLALWKLLGSHYTTCLKGALQRAWERKKLATLRHFLQAGHLSFHPAQGSSGDSPPRPFLPHPDLGGALRFGADRLAVQFYRPCQGRLHYGTRATAPKDPKGPFRGHLHPV